MSDRLPQLSTFAPGSIVAVRYYALAHVGVVSDMYDANGYPWVISNSRRMGEVTEEPQGMFALGREPYLVSEPKEAPAAMLARARACLGKRYDIFTYNCEHFVSEATGSAPKSRQLRVVGVISGAAAAVYIGLGRWPK